MSPSHSVAFSLRSTFEAQWLWQLRCPHSSPVGKDSPSDHLLHLMDRVPITEPISMARGRSHLDGLRPGRMLQPGTGNRTRVEGSRLWGGSEGPARENWRLVPGGGMGSPGDSDTGGMTADLQNIPVT